MCVLSIKLPIRKKYGNLFNEPCMSMRSFVVLTGLTFVSWMVPCGVTNFKSLKEGLPSFLIWLNPSR